MFGGIITNSPKANLTSVESTSKYWAIPPQTPISFLSVSDR